MQQLIQQIEQWAEDRNLIHGSTPQKQMLKLMEEFGELCGGIAKNKPEIIKDSIGDCFVVLVLLNKQLDIADDVYLLIADVTNEYQNGLYEHTSIEEQLLDAIHNLGGISIPVNLGWKVKKEYIELLFLNLVIIALFNGLDFNDCVQHAYDQIKDRKGKIVEGVFVKEEDLNE